MKQKYYSYLSKRSKPLNYSKENAKLFEHELRKKIDSPRYKTLNSRYVKNSTIRRYKYFRTNTSAWRMNPINHKNRIKRLLEDLKFINTESQKNDKYKIIKKGSWVVDERSDQYFHWLTDCMQRIQLIDEELYNYPILIPEEFLKKEYVIESLSFLNIPFIEIKNDTLYKIDKLLITNHVGNAGNYYKEIINQVSRRFSEIIGMNNEVIKNNSNKKIWVSRQNASKRKIKNFEEVAKVLTKHEFIIVDYESLPFIEQIKISFDAEIIAGLHGAGLTNMIFMKKNSLIIEVRDESDNKNNCFFSLSSDLNHKYYFIPAKADQDDYYSSDYYLDAKVLDESLNKGLSIFNNS